MAGGNLLYGVENISFFDSYWAIIHFASGLALGIIFFILNSRFPRFGKKYYFAWGTLVLLIWEGFEIVLRLVDEGFPELARMFKNYIPEVFFEIESPLNVTSDLILGLLGLAVVYILSKKVNFLN